MTNINMVTNEKFTMLSTEFLRVSKSKVVQVQIHPEFLDLQKKSSQSSKVSWFEKTHLREILDLIKPVVLARCNHNPDAKGGGGAKKSPEIDRILSGESVRIGYEFKRKESNDTCLIDPRSIINCLSDDNEQLSYKHSYRFFHIHKEKMLVYVCPIDQDKNQNIMTQLYGLVGGRGERGGGRRQNTIGISSYFQKSPQNKTATEPSSSSSSQLAVTSDTTSKTTSTSTVTTTQESTIAVRSITHTASNTADQNLDHLDAAIRGSKTTAKNVLKSTNLESKAKNVPTSTAKVVQKTRSESAAKSERETSENDEGPRTKIKNIIKKSGPKLSRRNKGVKKSKSENLTSTAPKQSNLTELLSFKKTKTISKVVTNPDMEIVENEVKSPNDLDMFSCSSSEDGSYCSDFKRDIFDPGKTSSNLLKKNNMKTYSNIRSKLKRKHSDTDLEIEPNIKDVFPSQKVAEDDLTAFAFKNYSKPEKFVQTKVKHNLQRKMESEKEELKVENDPFEFESDSKEELELKDKINKLKSAVNKEIGGESPTHADKIQNSEFAEITDHDDLDNESQNLEEKIQKLKSCIRQNVSSDDQKSITSITSNGYSVQLPTIHIEKCDNMRLDDRDDFRLDNLTDSDCPDSSTPVLSKTKPRFNFPRLSNIYQCYNTTSTTSASDVKKLKISNFTSDSQTSDTEIDTEFVVSKNSIINQRALPQRKTPRIPILDQSELPELPVLSSIKDVKKRKRTETKSKPKAKTKSRKIRDSEIPKDSTSKTDSSILDFFSRLSPSKSLRASDIERDAIEVKEDFDVRLIEELSDMPKVKNEGNLELQREILKLDDVADLNEAQIRFMVLNSETYLRDIFQGKTACERHQDYKRGGKDRNNLNYQVHLDLFTEEQTEIVMETLMGIFCKNHHKYLDYLLKVLLPEILIRIYMEVKGTNYSQTEEIMRN